jgi:hypothetical protein
MSELLSILLPTRGRTEMLERSVGSLLDHASDAANIEWLMAFDDDDADSLEYFKTKILSRIESSGGAYEIMMFPRLGYQRLNEYINALAAEAQGEWMIFWNDDAVMEHQGWDDEIRSHTGKFVVQAFDTHKGHPYSIFPIVPRAWFDVLGHLSLHPLNDAWISQIAWLMDIMLRTDMRVSHDRFDLTGNNKDATFDGRRMWELEGNPANPRDFNNLHYRQLRMQDAHRLYQWMKDNDHDVTAYEECQQGRRDPWAKMLAFDRNNQMTRYK